MAIVAVALHTTAIDMAAGIMATVTSIAVSAVATAVHQESLTGIDSHILGLRLKHSKISLQEIGLVANSLIERCQRGPTR